MAAGTVRVKGLKELQRDFRKMSREVSKEIRDGLREAAEPVRAEASSRFSSIDARSAAGYRVAVRTRCVSVEQRRRRTTGRHPEFGSLQMRRALLPALAAKENEVVDGVDHVLGKLAGENGF